MKKLLYILMFVLLSSLALAQIYCYDGDSYVQISAGDIDNTFTEENITWNSHDYTNNTVEGNDIPLGGLFNGTSGVVFVIIIAGLFYMIVKHVILRRI